MKRLLALLLLIPALALGQVTTNPGVTGVPAIPGQLPGTTTNDSAGAGRVGEILSASVTSGSAVSLVTGTAKTVTSIDLTAGDWDASGVVCFTGNAATTARYSFTGTSQTNNTLGALGSYAENFIALVGVAVFSLVDVCYTLPTQRYSNAATTTTYLIASLEFAVNTASAYGVIRARRVR